MEAKHKRVGTFAFTASILLLMRSPKIEESAELLQNANIKLRPLFRCARLLFRPQIEEANHV